MADGQAEVSLGSTARVCFFCIFHRYSNNILTIELSFLGLGGDGNIMAKDGLLHIKKQLAVPDDAQPCIVQPSSPLALRGKKLSSVAFMVLILTVTQ